VKVTVAVSLEELTLKVRREPGVREEEEMERMDEESNMADRKVENFLKEG
jgi:hypothetical protein